MSRINKPRQIKTDKSWSHVTAKLAKETSDRIKEQYRQTNYLRPLGARIPLELPSVLELPED